MAHSPLAVAPSPLGDIEELARCSCCRSAFDAADHEPKLLACQHHFCLACARSVLGRGRAVCCAHCRATTAPPGGRAECLPTHAPVLALARRLHAAPPAPAAPDTCAAHALPALWCASCALPACRACPAHAAHALRPAAEARALLLREARALHHDLLRLDARRRDALLRALDATTALKLRLEAELAAPALEPEPPGEGGSLVGAAAERDRLRARHAAALLQARLDDLVRETTVPLDFELLRRALTAPGEAEPAGGAGLGAGDPLLYLANFCSAALFARGDCAGSPRAGSPAPARPRCFLQLEVDGAPAGRVVVALRPDAAPRMARNFAALCAGGGAGGAGYAGCAVLQCWEGESVIAGDTERNDGRGGRSAFEEGAFMPDDSRLACVRGAVGMRRSQKRRDHLGLVSSQFRIVLREMRGFTAIFGAVVEGLPLVDALSRAGDGAGKPSQTIVIANCGRLD